MTFTEILKTLNTLESTSSSNEKKNILKEAMTDMDFCRVLTFALDPKMTYHIKKLPEPRNNLFHPAKPMGMREVFSMLKTLDAQTGATDSQKLELASGVSNCKDTAEVTRRILKKDLRCGVKIGLVNKVHPGFIKVWPYMRCKSHSEKNLEKIKYPAFSQLKADGTHIDIMCSNGIVSFHSRIGREYNFLGQLDDDAGLLFEEYHIDGVFIGEGTVVDENGNTLDRATGNGIITKGLKGTLTEEEARRIRISLWEFVELDEFKNNIGHTKYEDSWEFVLYRTSILNKIKPIECEVVNDYEEAIIHYKDVKSRGLEGLILKNFSGTFKATDSGTPNQVKVKAVLGEEYEAEFRLIRVNPGKEGTRFQNGVGSFEYISECGKIHGNVGSGLSHEQRDSLTTEDIENTIATIRFDDLVKDKRDNSTWSLYAPRIVELFRDKTKADTLEYVQELIGA